MEQYYRIKLSSKGYIPTEILQKFINSAFRNTGVGWIMVEVKKEEPKCNNSCIVPFILNCSVYGDNPPDLKYRQSCMGFDW